MSRDVDIVYEAHAREQMIERGISEGLVRATLEVPDQVRPAVVRPHREPCTIYIRHIEGRRCKVYVRAGSNPPIVATVAWHGEGPRGGARWRAT